jgi:hypothetical protein
MTKRILAAAGVAAAVALGFWIKDGLVASRILPGGETRDEELERRLAAVELHLQHLPPERVS